MVKWFKDYVHLDTDEIWFGVRDGWFFKLGFGLPYGFLWFLTGLVIGAGVVILW